MLTRVLPRPLTGWAIVIATDLALCELMQQQLARFADGFYCRDLAAQAAKLLQPLACVERQLCVDLLAQPL